MNKIHVAIMPSFESLGPTISDEKGVLLENLQLPVTFRKNNRIQLTQGDQLAFFHSDLLTLKLDKIHRHLWLAGLPRAARPLHRQKLLGREIYATENPDEHLVWNGTRIFIKPLPGYLLRDQFWDGASTLSEAISKSARGLLLSYVWLVGNKNDFRIALEVGLLPDSLTWEDWAARVPEILKGIDMRTLQGVDRRYIYGELRLTRLNSLYRCGAAGFSSFNLVHGFMMGSERYDTFFQRNFGWILAVLLYVTVVLSAVQVALATERLQSDAHFQLFSYSITILSLAMVAAAFAVIVLVWLGLFGFHILSTMRYCKKVEEARKTSLV